MTRVYLDFSKVSCNWWALSPNEGGVLMTLGRTEDGVDKEFRQPLTAARARQLAGELLHLAAATEPANELEAAEREVQEASLALLDALRKRNRAAGKSLFVICPYCEGSGREESFSMAGPQEAPGAAEPCGRCEGTGKTLQQLPWVVNEVEFDEKPTLQTSMLHPQAKWVRVRPVAKEYEKKTFLGYMLGDLALSTGASLDQNGKMTVLKTHHNPAIFVPALGKVVMGCESWWAEIKNPEDARDISDATIDNVWYVRALKDLAARPAGNAEPSES